MQWAVIADAGEIVDLGETFGVGRPVILDIGFGGGQELVDIARTRPDEAVIGVEIHTPGIARVLAAVEDGLANVRVVDGDALEFLDRIAPGSLAGIRIFFPDPWPKVRQRGRRLVQTDNVRRLIDRLELGGTLHLATDVADYATQMEAVCAADGRLDGGRVARPDWRPETRFERRGRDEGRASVDLMYERVRA